MSAPINRIGARIGSMIVVAEGQRRTFPGGLTHRQWICECECGNRIERPWHWLNSGRYKSCGCRREELINASKIKHGHCIGRKPSKTYMIWRQMLSRCDNPKNKRYADYGGRGIWVSPQWRSFENFLDDMGEAPEGLSIDRIDNDSGYCKDNCRWATKPVQRRNARNTTFVLADGERLCLSDACARAGVDSASVYRTARRDGLTVQAAFDYHACRKSDRAAA